MLFNKRGAVIVGREGISTMFMVGVAHLPDPVMARERLGALRAQLLADPYFRAVPSMHLRAGKTALCFHATDDLPEVRREVFRLLPQLGAEVQVAIRRKHEMVGAARMAHRRGGRLTANDIYDDLVKRLFKNLLHQGEVNEICFARRGKADRQAALEAAIARAKHNFSRKWNTPVDRPTRIRPSVPSQDAGLQVIDYYLWALQRFFERREDRYFASVSNAYRLIMDIDDTRSAPYGAYYSAKNPLTMEKVTPPTG